MSKPKHFRQALDFLRGVEEGLHRLEQSPMSHPVKLYRSRDGWEVMVQTSGTQDEYWEALVSVTNPRGKVLFRAPDYDVEKRLPLDDELIEELLDYVPPAHVCEDVYGLQRVD